MENNLVDEVGSKLSIKDYILKARHKYYEDDREYPENFSNWYPHIKSFGQFKHAEIITNQIFTEEELEILEKVDNIEKLNKEAIEKVLKSTMDKMKPRSIL